MNKQYTIDDLLYISNLIKNNLDNSSISNKTNIDIKDLNYMFNKVDIECNSLIYNSSKLYLIFSFMYGVSFIGGIIVFLYKI